MFTLVQEPFDWAWNRKSSINIMYCFIYLTYSHLFSPAISFAFWMDHLILSKNQFIILKPMSRADSSFCFPVHKCARPSFLENLHKLPSSTFFCSSYSKGFPCLTDLVPMWVSLLVHHFWMHPPSDLENALSLEGHSWQGSCFPINTGSSDAETKSKGKIGWTNTTAAKHRNCGKMHSYKG